MRTVTTLGEFCSERCGRVSSLFKMGQQLLERDFAWHASVKLLETPLSKCNVPTVLSNEDKMLLSAFAGLVRCEVHLNA